MDVRLINPFIEATLHVLSSMAFTKATAGNPYLKKDSIAKGDVSGIVGLSGEARGTISVSFSEESILALSAICSARRSWRSTMRSKTPWARS